MRVSCRFAGEAGSTPRKVANPTKSAPSKFNYLGIFCSFVKTGAQVTPEVAVYHRSANGLYELVYLGRIDDQYQNFGKWRREPHRKELEEVLDALVEGETVALRKTRAIGCYIGE